ncbi:hypothetical protein LIS44_16150 (plasmid) [Acinetobacter haemolyticus]|uniref:hypothetical protein n=1 Tax=unclassified Acinetobacter TaxID=196816 RepID=UPI00211DB3F7|nr:MULTISPECIES: hypothetical protein [unclassified Acinetobacter]UDM39714.1 hypothetical protein LIS44_16150 [Acinetobacter haemolyticus]
MMNHFFKAISAYAQQDPTREAIVTDRDRLNYAELKNQLEQLRAELIKLNIQRLALWGVNSVDWIIIDLAA